MDATPNLHQFLDFYNGADALDQLKSLLTSTSIDLEHLFQGETVLHTACRRRRFKAMQVLIEHGAHIDVKNQYGKTAYVHAIRRGFTEIATYLDNLNCDVSMTQADELAVLMTSGDLHAARKLIESNPKVVRTGNPEEDRLLADLAGRFESEPVRILVDSGADLLAPALDNGTPLHQAAWFGQPDNARILLAAGAPLEVFDQVHQSSPLGWAVHGSRYSGGAHERQDVYVTLVRMLFDYGARLYYPNGNDSSYFDRLMNDATTEVKPILQDAWKGAL